MTPETVTNETQPNVTEICWEFKGLDGKPFMQIRGYNTELCYQLWEWGTTKKRTGGIVEEWKPMECYPWSLRYALIKVGHYMLVRQGGYTDDVRQMLKTVREIHEQLKEVTQ